MTPLEQVAFAAQIAQHHADIAIRKYPQGSAESDAAIEEHIIPFVVTQVAALCGTKDAIDEVTAMIYDYREGRRP